MDEVSITLSIGVVTIPTHPVFGDDVKLKITSEENQIFYRTKIDGSIKFSGDDFDFIESCYDEVEFTLTVNRGSSLIGSGTFIKPDCTMDYDDKVCTVKLTITDRYEGIMKNLDNKYNLVRLAPKTDSVYLCKRPVLQFYAMGDTKISNIFGNMSFEVDAVNDAQSKSDADLTSHAWTNVFHRVMATVTSTNASVPDNAKGEYTGTLTTMQTLVLTNENNYKLKYEKSVGGEYRFALYDSSNNKVLYQSTTGTYIGIYLTSESQLSEFYASHTLIAYNSDDSYILGIGSVELRSRSIYGRLLVDRNITPTGWVDSPIAFDTLSDDIYDNVNSNYTYVCGIYSFSGKGDVISSANKTSDPTEYFDGNGQYYVKPTPYSTHGVVFPLGQSMWNEMSFWYMSRPEYALELDNYFNTPSVLKDAYPLYSAIQVLLAEVAPDVTYDPTLSVHEFFRENFDTDEIRTMPSGYIPSPRSRKSRLYITPITNIKKTRYEQAAQRGDITLKQITDMLRDLYGCYWFIDDNNEFRIEHISYFKNNHAYLIGIPQADIDVVAMNDRPNKLSWAFGTNEVEYDRNRCPSRYEFSWGDKCTEQFNGEAINIEDRFVSQDKKEKIQIVNFTADIDYTIISPNSVSDDIYALFEARETTIGDVSQLDVLIPLVHLGTAYADPYYYIQNGYCSFLFAENNYLNYDLGGWKANAGGVYLNVMGVRQYRTQNINFPMPIAKVANIGAIKTGIGVGLVKEQEINADTLLAKTTVVLEGEKDYASYVEVYSQGSGPHGTKQWFVKNNHPYNYLEVNYYAKDSTSPTPWDDNNLHTSSIAPNASVNVGYYYGVTILSVRLYGQIKIQEPLKLGVGDMQISISNYYSGADIIFDGQQTNNGCDWAYVCIEVTARTRINIHASTEASYDLGYVATRPLLKRTDVFNDALETAGGTMTAQYIAEAGEVLFLGYTKDSSSYGNNDRIEFELEVP